jgi:Tol biopolymer transport system component
LKVLEMQFRFALLIVFAVIAMAGNGHARAPEEFAQPQPVVITGYQGHAMEPFITRDGRYLLFNNLNDPSENTDLHWAERVSAEEFRYRGKVSGTNTPALEGVPTVDRNGNLYFVSTRSYEQTLSTIYRGRFENGSVAVVELVEGISPKIPGIVNFDAEISSDGDLLVGVDGDLTGGPMPKTADLFLARRAGNRFQRMPGDRGILANLNTSALEYAPALSQDSLEIFFTRLTKGLFGASLTIEHAVRAAPDQPFPVSTTIGSISGFVEAPSVTGDGKTLYFHQKVDGVYRIFRTTRDRAAARPR